MSEAKPFVVEGKIDDEYDESSYYTIGYGDRPPPLVTALFAAAGIPTYAEHPPGSHKFRDLLLGKRVRITGTIEILED